MLATSGTRATAVTQATAVKPATSNSRSANTVKMPAKAGTLAKVVKPATACRKANYSRDTIYIRVTVAEMSAAAGLSESEEKSLVPTVEKLATCSRDSGCQMPQMPERTWPQATTMSFRRNRRKIRETVLFASPVVEVR
jgi:hypothetical protein